MERMGLLGRMGREMGKLERGRAGVRSKVKGNKGIGTLMRFRQNGEVDVEGEDSRGDREKREILRKSEKVYTAE